MSRTQRKAMSIRLLKFGAAVVIAAQISSCGIVKVQEFQEMTAAELAQKSDEFICDAGARIQLISTLPVVWIRELRKRDLWECVSQYRKDGGSTRVIIQQNNSQ